METKAISLEVFKALEDKKGVDIKVLDVRHLTSITDFFVIATGTSSRHVSSLAESVEEDLDKLGIHPSHKEGHRTGEWVLIDYLDVIVHVFTEENREFYKLEKMWRDAKYVQVNVDTF